MDIDTIRNYDELFKTAGWSQVIEEAESELTGITARITYDAKDFTEVAFLRGRLDQLSSLVNLESTLIAMLQAEDEEDEDAVL